MNKKKNFMMVPCGIDKDPRLQPWMQQKYVNSHEVIWAVERMISRLSQKPKERFSIQDLTANLYNPHLPYRLLKELIIGSGFFDYNDAGVRYNWDLFDYFSKQNEEEESPNCSPIDPQSATNPTCARTSSSTNRRVKQNIDVDIDVDNNPPLKKEKEKKSEEDSIDEAAKSAARAAVDAVLNAPAKAPATDGYEERIRNIVMNYRFRKGSLDNWEGSTMEEKRQNLAKHLIWKLDDAHSEEAESVGSSLGIENYKAQWRDIVMAYVKVLNSSGYISKLVNSDKIGLYLDIFSGKTNAEANTYQEGTRLLKEIKKLRKARIEREKQRYPFEDYNPETGLRYVGNEIIPRYAPPRPDNRSVWDGDEGCWISPEEKDARRAAGLARLEAYMAMYDRERCGAEHK